MKTHFWFPITEESSEKNECPRKQNKGISLFIALISTALVVVFIADITVSSAVNIRLSSAAKNKIQSEYLAKSGANLAVFLLSISKAVDLGIKKKSKAASSSVESRASMWALFNSLPPIGANSINLSEDTASDPFKTSGIMNEDSRNLMAKLKDQFTIKIEDESSKLNINDCKTSRKDCIKRLKALFSCPVEKQFLDDEASVTDGTKLTVDSVADHVGTSGLSSIEELKSLDGWSDRVHKIFSPYLTVYSSPGKTQKSGKKTTKPPKKTTKPGKKTTKPGKKTQSSKININTAPRELLACLILPKPSTDCNDYFAEEMDKIESGGQVLDNKTLNTFFGTLKSQCSNAPNVKDWFGGQSEIFRIIVTAKSGSKETTLTMIVRWGRNKKKSHKYRFDTNVGNAYRNYEILSWHMT